MAHSDHPAARLALEHVEARYVRRSILCGVSLQLPAGEVLALLGPNGAGKSTVLKAVCGLAEVTAGRVLFDGRDITGRRPAQNLHDGVAFLPQGGQVFGPLTVAENLRLAAAMLPGGDVRGRVAAALDRSPTLAARRHQRASSLSGGEKQQLALAMALLGRPRLLLVDEPSIGLAPRLAHDALGSLREVVAEADAALLLVEQNVPLALEYADRCALILDGRVAAEATTAAIRGDDALRRQFTFGLAEVEG